MDFGLGGATSTAILAQAVSIFYGMWPLILIAIGIPLGFYIIRKVIAVLPKK